MFVAIGLLGCGSGDGPVGFRGDARPDVEVDAEAADAEAVAEDTSVPDAYALVS